MPLKVALVTPPYHSGVVETAGDWPNVAFVYIAGALRAAGFAPVIYDAMTMGHDLERIGDELVALAPDVVLTTCYTSSYPKAVELLRTAKRRLGNVVTGIGGVHVDFMYAESLREDGDAIDFVLRGEGEQTAPELMRCLAEHGDPAKVRGIAFMRDSELVVTPSRPFLASLDGLPMAWDLVDWDIYHFYPLPDTHLAIVSTSRGCNQACTFCSQQAFWHRTWRGRSPEDLVGELAMLHETYGVGVVMFSDETPTLDRARWERILDLLIERDLGMRILMETRVDDVLRDEDILWKYHAAGVHHVYVGVERTDQRSLDLFKKNTSVQMGKQALDLLRAHDIITETSFVLGLPDDTVESIKATFELALHYDPDLAFFLTISPWPYADIYADLEPYVVSHDYEDYNLVAPVVKPKAMETDELMRLIIDCYREFYLRKLDRIPEMPPAKRDYFLTTMRLLMDNSYLTRFMGGLGDMPEEVEELLAEWS